MSAYEQVYQPLYDSVPITFGDNLRFFTQPYGSNKRYSRTNMHMAGCLPAPQQFLLQKVHVDVTGSDVFRQRVAGQGSLELIIGNKTYLTLGPLGVFMPTRLRLRGRLVPRRFKLDEAFDVQPLFIAPHQFFAVNVYMDFWPRSQKELMYVHLGGHIYRPEQ